MGGKGLPKKDLGLIAMSYGYVYVARIAMGANDQQALRALIEAESYDGPSLIIAYSPCIAHGYDMAKSLEQAKLAVQSGHWPMYRYDPRLAEQGQNPLVIESKNRAFRSHSMLITRPVTRCLLKWMKSALKS
jgi:pyruvate-ferredoxin/flavodoxin oxidoreductase